MLGDRHVAHPPHGGVWDLHGRVARTDLAEPLGRAARVDWGHSVQIIIKKKCQVKTCVAVGIVQLQTKSADGSIKVRSPQGIFHPSRLVTELSYKTCRGSHT